MRWVSATPDALGRPIDHVNHLGSELRTAPLPQPPLRLRRGEPGGVAVLLQRWRQVLHLAEVGVDQHNIPVRACPRRLAVPVGDKGTALYRSGDAGLFVGFTRSSIGGGCILVDSALGEGPFSVPGTHQEKFRLASAHAIAHSCHMNALKISAWRR